ncbi:MAG: ABC transporter ATP-binding protein [Bacteroidota bacterium]
MIKLNGIKKSFSVGNNTLQVLKGIDLHVKNGEFVSIMGSSGSGKSTLLNILGILDEPDSGEFTLDNKKMSSLSEAKAAKYRNEFLGFVFQSFNLISYKTALENVALPLYYKKVPRSERTKIARKYLEKVGLGPWEEHLPTELSGGQKQRVAIARALVTNPKVILADEPTGALDSITSHEVMKLFREINEEGITLVVITHEQDIAEMSDRIIHLKDGVIIDQPADELTSQSIKTSSV